MTSVKRVNKIQPSVREKGEERERKGGAVDDGSFKIHPAQCGFVSLFTQN